MKKKINLSKVLAAIKTGISYFGAICLGSYVAIAIETGVNADLVLGAALSALLMVVAKISVKEDNEEG